MPTETTAPAFIGFDLAEGEDCTVETVFERMPDGTIRLMDRGLVIDGEAANQDG